MYGHHCSQAISAFAIKACVLATKSHALKFCEATIYCDMWEPIMQDTKGFFPPKKKSKAQSKKIQHNDFRKVLISNSIPDALRDLHTFKYKRLRNKPNDGCLWKPAKCNNEQTTAIFCEY